MRPSFPLPRTTAPLDMGRVTASALLNLLLQRASASTRRASAHDKRTPAVASVLLHAKSGDLQKAISLLGDHTAPNPIPDSAYAALFRFCASHRALFETRRVQSHLLVSRPHPPTFLLNRAIETYAKCGCIADARELFDEIPDRDGGTWNAIIVAYAQMDHAEEVLSLFSRMNGLGVRGNHITFASVLGACGDLQALWLVLQIHGLAVKLGFRCDLILGCSLVDSYDKCGLLDEAAVVFDAMPSRNSVVWNVIVRRYLEVGRMQEAIFMFFQMVRAGVSPLNYTVSNALQACTGILALEEGRQIHGILVRIGLEGDNVVGTSLTKMYAECGLHNEARRSFDLNDSRDVACLTSMISLYAMNGRMEKAEELFNEMPQRNVVSWNAMLAGYVQSLRWEKALDFILWIQKEIVDVDHVTLRLILNVCVGLSDLDKGKQVHGFAYRHGFTSICAVGNSLLDMYVKCRSLKAAETWFNEMSSIRDTVSWNTLIRSFACHKHSESALAAFRVMQREAIPNYITYSSVLIACSNLSLLKRGKQIHGHMIMNGCSQDAMLSASLINMYSKCRSLELAAKVFAGERSMDPFLWNSMILGCAYNGYGREALNLFETMKTLGIRANGVTFRGIFRACISEGLVDWGQKYFKSMSDNFSVLPQIEHYDCMIDLFGRHGHLVELEELIQAMPFEPSMPMWKRILNYCCEYRNSRLGYQAAECIDKLRHHGSLNVQVI